MIQFLYFERNARTKSFIKTIMYNSTCTNSHRDIEEYLAPFPLVARAQSLDERAK